MPRPSRKMLCDGVELAIVNDHFSISVTSFFFSLSLSLSFPFAMHTVNLPTCQPLACIACPMTRQLSSASPSTHPQSTRPASGLAPHQYWIAILHLIDSQYRDLPRLLASYYGSEGIPSSRLAGSGNHVSEWHQLTCGLICTAWRRILQSMGLHIAS